MIQPQIKGKINANTIKVGKGVIVEEGAIINATEVVLGDYCYIGNNVKIITPKFRIGDYSKLHAYSFAHGEKPMQIGRNCWIGGNTVLDSLGGLDIDDNVGIGAHSQIWTHIQFGDIVEGCKFYSKKYMYVGKDAWLVGHCILSPVNVGARSMALVGSVITKDMEPNHIYAGSPAKDITDKIGTQFEDRVPEQKAVKLQELINKFETNNPKYAGRMKVVLSKNDMHKDDFTYFNVSDRTYTKNHTEAEMAFLKANVPLIKFVPHNEPNFIVRGDSEQWG